jgi:hypothetical protein
LGNTRSFASKLHLLCLLIFLNGCAVPLLLMSPQGQLLWALMKPMVGLDPNDVGLFEQPLIKGRMQSILGPHYDNTMKILATADEIQQQGPLYYVISNHSPIPEVAEKAGFVWNAENNQMAVMLLTGGSPQVFAEKLIKDKVKATADDKVQEVKEEVRQAGKEQITALVPQWPTELTDAIMLAKPVMPKASLPKN